MNFGFSKLKFILTKGRGEFFNVRYSRYSGYNVILNFYMKAGFWWNWISIEIIILTLLSYFCDRL